MDFRELATILLTFRLLSDTLIAVVMYWQWQLFKHPIEPRLRFRRKLFFGASVAIFLGNKIPMAMDYLAITGELARNQPSSAGIAYSLDNAVTIFVLTFIIFLLYLTTRLDNKRHEAIVDTLPIPDVTQKEERR